MIPYQYNKIVILDNNTDTIDTIILDNIYQFISVKHFQSETNLFCFLTIPILCVCFS